MHVLIPTDQHPSSLGGAQVSIRLQQRFLRLAGHEATVVSAGPPRAGDPSDVVLRGPAVTRDREYGAAWPGRAADRRIDAALAALPPVDVVHVQGDFWGAVAGHRAAARLGVPVVHTMHNHLAAGLAETTPGPRVAARALLAFQRLTLGPSRSPLRGTAWAYLDGFARRADAVVAPSAHFAELLAEHGVGGDVRVVRTGIDDAVLDAALAGEGEAVAEPRRDARPVLVWLGRMSEEKRLLPFLDALALAAPDAEVRVFGSGRLRGRAEDAAARARAAGSPTLVRFLGPVPYPRALAEIAAADALVQTSVGFETQGMTVFEAAALGTRVVASDPDIAAELPPALVLGPAGEDVGALAREIAAAVAAAGTPVGPPPGGLRQSELTAELLALYGEVIAGARRG